jgi:hypothetical protein
MKMSLIILALVLFVSCEKLKQNSDAQVAVKPKLKFELVQLGSMRRDQFLLDKETGQLWRITCIAGAGQGGDCKYSAWMKEDVEGINTTSENINSFGDQVEKSLKEKRK